jgi:hypothetical protein
MRLNPSLGRDSGVQSCPLPVGAPAIWRLRAKAVRNVSPQIQRKGVSGQSCSLVAGGVFVACCCRRFWYSGCPNVHVALVIEHVRGFWVKKHGHVVGVCLQSVPRSVSCGVSDTFWKNFASCHPLLVSTDLRVSNGCIAHISAAVSDAGIMSGSRDLPNVLAWRLSYGVSVGTRMPEYWSVYEPPGGSVLSPRRM